MAERVVARDDEVDEVLERYARGDWMLVAVIRYQYDPGPREPNEECRELYFERRNPNA